MATRRNFLPRAAQLGGALALTPLACSAQVGAPADNPFGVAVNDVQSQLNAATVRRIVEPTSIDDLQVAFVTARFDNPAVSIGVGRHTRDGQQFGRDTVLLERDTDSFLPRAVEPSVCIVCNLHVTHTDEGRAKAAADFRRIIARAIRHGGRYYVTYHRFADRKQVETCYPKFTEFLKLKRKYDPEERLQSDW